MRCFEIFYVLFFEILPCVLSCVLDCMDYSDEYLGRHRDSSMFFLYSPYLYILSSLFFLPNSSFPIVIVHSFISSCYSSSLLHFFSALSTFHPQLSTPFFCSQEEFVEAVFGFQQKGGGLFIWSLFFLL